LKVNAEACANVSLSSFKDYNHQGITLEQQEQYLQSCIDKLNLTKCADYDCLYDAPCVRKATEEQKQTLACFCEELDKIIGGKCNINHCNYGFIDLFWQKLKLLNSPLESYFYTFFIILRYMAPYVFSASFPDEHFKDR
jgi:hypothetical protein